MPDRLGSVVMAPSVLVHGFPSFWLDATPRHGCLDKIRQDFKTDFDLQGVCQQSALAIWM
jgi:hypothetical protein